MIKLFTHTDLDGIGCAILAKIAFGDEVDVEYCNYNNINDIVEAFYNTCQEDKILKDTDKVYITDISVSDELAKKIDNPFITGWWKLFDHHATAEHLNKYNWCTVRTDRITFVEPFKTCGTELFYEHLQQKGYISGSSKTLREFVNFVRDYDTWAWKTFANGQPIKQFNDLLYILGRDEFIERCLKRYKGNRHIVEFSKEEQKLLDKRQAEIDAYVEKKMKESTIHCIFTDSGTKLMCSVVFADRFISELGNRICENDDFIDCAMIIDMGACKISYRTVRPDVDVSELAKFFGGGGHRAAAGNYFDLDIKTDLIVDLCAMMRGDWKNDMICEEAKDEQIEKPKKKFKLFGRK
jgi:oligoribonuclease NrnB/cAMP/cGMP phosphodiesterase (DHH superfamily)